ncbi:MAG: Hsp20/alpha crystallin family protein [Deltaproteobacteria bacterium]|nr:Hsp20/alpha crystallin family protein [Deltaproteobacteria bacterium]
MARLIIWKNQEMNRFRRDMDRLFERVWDDFGMRRMPLARREYPVIDFIESNDTLTITAEIPGMNPEDFDISITDNLLTIEGEMKKEMTDKEGNYHHLERNYGFFSRTIELPCKVNVEDINATYKKGILSIVLPKCEPEACREIRVKIK